MSIPSGARVIKVSRGREIKEPVEEKQQPQVFVDMQKTMEDELERRKKDWESEVERMQGDFFQMDTGPASKDTAKDLKVVHGTSSTKRTPGGVEIVHEDSLRQSPGSGGAEIFDICNNKNLYNEMPDGSRTFKLRFDVHGFESDEISVRAEGDKLNVNAKHEDQVSKGGGKTARQFNRQVDIPYNVDPDKIVSHLSSEGILSVEAPIEDVPKVIRPAPAIHVQTTVHGHSSPDLDEPPFMPPGYHSVVHQSHPSYSRRVVHQAPAYSRRVVHETPGYSRVVRTQNYEGGRPLPGSHVVPILYQGDPASQYDSVIRSISPGRVVTTTRSSTSPRMHRKAFSYNSASIEDTDFGKKMKLVVDLGGKYKPEEISLKFVGHKIHLKAKHEEKIGGRTSHCEFSREFDIPEEIEMRTARAMMADTGKIHIGGSVKDNDNHDQVLEYVLMDMPGGGKPITITRE